MERRGKNRKKARRGYGGGQREPQPPRTTLPRPDFNWRQSIIFVPTVPANTTGASASGTPEGGPGPYTVTFVLSIPGSNVFRAELDLAKIMASGQSLLMPQANGHIQVDIQDVPGPGHTQVLVHPGADGTFGRAQVQIIASNFYEAQRKAHNAIQPLLSWWAFLYDVGIDIFAYELWRSAPVS